MKNLKTTLAGLAAGGLELYANGLTGKSLAFAIALTALGKLSADAPKAPPAEKK